MQAENAPLSDLAIRRALRSWILARSATAANVGLIEELGLCRGQVRVDVAVVDEQLHGYEIKSDRDSLRRLMRQIDFYGKVLDRATLVVGDRHFEKATALVPAWWGVLRISRTANNLHLDQVRQGGDNPSLDPRSLVELLWRDDAVSLLEQYNSARGFRSKPRQVVWDRVCNCLDIEVIGHAVRAHLKSRPGTLALVGQL